MACKFPFEFDFDENADPVEELHRLRIATAKHFKTLKAIMEYHRSTPPIKELIAELDEKIAEKKAKTISSHDPKATKMPTRRQKAVKV